MKYLIAVLAAALCAAQAYAILNKQLADKLAFFNIASGKHTYESRPISARQCLLLAAAVAVLSFAAAVRLLLNVSEWINVCKMLLALLCMAGAACFDYRERRIPNLFALVMALGGVVLLALGVITRQNGAYAYITSSAVAAVACALLLTLASVLTRQGIGAGDIKLISAFAIMTGVPAVMGTLFFAIVLCGIAAVFALALKKKTMQSSFPFGPFLFVGYVAAILTLNF